MWLRFILQAGSFFLFLAVCTRVSEDLFVVFFRIIQTTVVNTTFPGQSDCNRRHSVVVRALQFEAKVANCKGFSTNACILSALKVHK